MGRADITVSYDGSKLYLLTPTTRAGKNWLNLNLAEDARQFGSAYVVEDHYIEDIITGMEVDGLLVSPV